MSLSPSNILQRLAELKNWQQNHEELLNKFKNATLDNTTTLSDYQTIEGLSAFETSTEDNRSPGKVDVDNQVVISPLKTFSQLLEEKLAEDHIPDDIPDIPKKPFLRKGTGLERFRMKRPPPNRVRNVKKNARKPDFTTPLRAPDLSIKPKATWTSVSESTKKIDNQSDQTLYEKALEKELRIFEALEERADNSSFCSTNSSVLKILSSSPVKVTRQPPIMEEKRVHWESQSEEEIESNLERRDIQQLLFNLQNLAEARFKPLAESSDDEKWTTETSSGNTSISSTDLEITLKPDKKDVGVGTEHEEACNFCCSRLKKTIEDYEDQVREVMEDKSKIVEVKRELERKKDILAKEFDKKIRDFEDEKVKIFHDLEEERKKLAKEKQLYQTYLKDSQNRPTKKERQEISHLKQEVADLKETLKLKESKTGLTQARLRNQIKQLEKENGNLKEEIEKLTKNNAKLNASQKLSRKSSESKILHEINKNVTRLALKSDQKRISPIKKKEDSLLEMTNFRNFANVEQEYENVFKGDFKRNATFDESKKGEDKSERVLPDGSKEISYSNGNVKTVSADGNLVTMKYYNGDIKQTHILDGIVKYFYFDKNIWQTTHPDGSEVTEFSNNMKETKYKDGKCEVSLPDGIFQTIYPDKTQEMKYSDGSILTIKPTGEKVLLLPNGQREIETTEHKRREYPDGTVKILYPDGTQETRYSNGRIRIRDSSGTLILDSQP